MAAPFAYTLIDKFSNGIPSIAEISPSLRDLKLKGRFTVSFMDYKHVIIRLFTEEDYTNLWLKSTILIGAIPMRMFKWSPNFSTKVESPIVPVWVTIKKVPLFLYYVEALFELVKPIGKPLRVDSHTANLSRLDKVRVCLEIDLSKPLLDTICVNLPESILFLNIIYEDIPK